MIAREAQTFPDLPIAGMQGHKEAVFITLDYELDDFTIRVENVFAWRDSETSEEFVPNDVAVIVGAAVRRFAALIEQFRAEPQKTPLDIRNYTFRLPPMTTEIPA